MRTLFTLPTAALFVVCTFAPLATGAPQTRTAVQRDVEGYAIASCLVRQTEPYLKDQGYAWIDVIIQRSEGDVEHLKRVAEAVEAQVAEGAMPMTRQEGAPKQAKALPVLLCAEIIDEEQVRSAIDKAIRKLSPAYRRAKR
jgi:hypothetical protein